jgi:hypothetical protein
MSKNFKNVAEFYLDVSIIVCDRQDFSGKMQDTILRSISIVFDPTYSYYPHDAFSRQSEKFYINNNIHFDGILLPIDKGNEMFYKFQINVDSFSDWHYIRITVNRTNYSTLVEYVDKSLED